MKNLRPGFQGYTRNVDNPVLYYIFHYIAPNQKISVELLAFNDRISSLSRWWHQYLLLPYGLHAGRNECNHHHLCT